MEISNLQLGDGVHIDPSTSINNVILCDGVKISKYCSIYGSKQRPLKIGKQSYVGMFSILNGYAARLEIGANVSIAQNVNIMTDSGPNASHAMQSVYPILKGCWIGASAIIMPNVRLGEFCVVAANSFVTGSFAPFTIVGGSPAKEIRRFSTEEIKRMKLE